MMVRIEFVRDHHAKTPAILKHAVRFARRLRQHGIYNYAMPVLVEERASACQATVGRRAVNIFNDGSSSPSLMLPTSFYSPRIGQYDHAAFRSQSHRMHAIYLTLASHARARRLKAHARSDINLAIQERLHHERSCSI